jgi:hypothetical protein
MKPTLLPRWLLLKKLAMTAIDDASARANEIPHLQAHQQISERVMAVQLHLGTAESTIEWMSEMLEQYKGALDKAAKALHGLQDIADVEGALEDIGRIQSGYLDGLDEPSGRPGV